MAATTVMTDETRSAKAALILVSSAVSHVTSRNDESVTGSSIHNSTSSSLSPRLNSRKSADEADIGEKLLNSVTPLMRKLAEGALEAAGRKNAQSLATFQSGCSVVLKDMEKDRAAFDSLNLADEGDLAQAVALAMQVFASSGAVKQLHNRYVDEVSMNLPNSKVQSYMDNMKKQFKVKKLLVSAEQVETLKQKFIDSYFDHMEKNARIQRAKIDTEKVKQVAIDLKKLVNILPDVWTVKAVNDFFAYTNANIDAYMVLPLWSDLNMSAINSKLYCDSVELEYRQAQSRYDRGFILPHSPTSQSSSSSLSTSSSSSSNSPDFSRMVTISGTKLRRTLSTLEAATAQQTFEKLQDLRVQVESHWVLVSQMVAATMQKFVTRLASLEEEKVVLLRQIESSATLEGYKELVDQFRDTVYKPWKKLEYELLTISFKEFESQPSLVAQAQYKYHDMLKLLSRSDKPKIGAFECDRRFRQCRSALVQRETAENLFNVAVGEMVKSAQYVMVADWREAEWSVEEGKRGQDYERYPKDFRAYQ